MSIHKSIAAADLLSLCAMSAAVPAQAQSRTHGVFGLYETASANLDVDETGVRSLGCDIARVGRIGAQDGDIGLARPNVFLMLSCSHPLLDASANASTDTRLATIDNLITGAQRIALFEGDLSLSPALATGDAVQGRQYIIKLTDYNSADPAARQRDLDEIGSLVAERADQYRAEAALNVRTALGARATDEVLLIYYESSAAGERFRSNNPDIMTRIGRFNGRYTSDFVYYVGAAER